MSVEEIITQLLERRGIEHPEHFIVPDFVRDTHIPQLLPGMDVGSKLLAQAVREQWNVAVFGDYDADGIPATALMIRALRRIGLEVHGIIPKRSEGYGLSKPVVQRIIQMGTQLLVTVDNGTVSSLEIAELMAQGVRTIVCDHHQPGVSPVADADAVINPKLADSKYPFRELCGATLAWKLLWATYEELGVPTGPLKWELDLVALATIADMVPLVGENRALAFFGLKVLAMSRNCGLQALAKVAGIRLADVSARDVGFALAPRLNAASRTHREEQEGVNVPLRLLVGSNSVQEHADAEYLDRCNKERQDLLREQVAEAIIQVQSQIDMPYLVAYSSEWSSGVIGLIAGRLAEMYSRPAIVMADQGGETKGSVRSVGNIDTVEWLGSVSGLLARFGGHAKAGGLTLATCGQIAVDQLRLQLQEYFTDRQLSLEMVTAQCLKHADVELEPEALTEELVKGLEALAPYGTGFELPLIGSTLTVVQASKVGKQGEHLSLRLSGSTKKSFKGIAFGMGGEDFVTGCRVQALFELNIQEWQGQSSLNATVRRLDLL